MNIDTSYRRIALLTYPVVIAQTSHVFMGVMDTVMVGRLGVSELGAVGFAGMVTWCFLSVLFGLFSSVNTVVAQAYGAGDDRACGVAFWQGMYLAAIGAVALAGLWVLIPTIYRVSGASAEVQQFATSYVRIRLLSGVGFGMLVVADNFYRGLGRTIVPMWFGILQCVLNMILNYGLIFGHFGLPALGTDGAALGTVIALTISGALLFATILLSPEVRRRYQITTTWRFDAAVFRRLLHIGWPTGVQSFFDMASINVFAACIARLGDAELAATNAGIQAWVMAMVPTIALSVSATTLVGHCVGAGQYADAHRIVQRLLRLGYLMLLGFAAVYLLAPGQIMAIFLKAEDLPLVLPYARPLFFIVVLCMAFEMQFNVGSGALRGAGDTLFPAALAIGVSWLVFVPLTIVVTPRFGLLGAWSGLFVWCVMIAGGVMLRLRGTRWLERAGAHPEDVVRAAAPGDPSALGAGRLTVRVK